MRTKTGNRIHRASNGSVQTWCGIRWARKIIASPSGIIGGVGCDRCGGGAVSYDIRRINWSGNISPQFKLALVLGPSRVTGKERVRVWLHRARRFTKPVAVQRTMLSSVFERELTSRHLGVLRACRAAADGLDG